jgi:hypothetical protein
LCRNLDRLHVVHMGGDRTRGCVRGSPKYLGAEGKCSIVVGELGVAVGLGCTRMAGSRIVGRIGGAGGVGEGTDGGWSGRG